MKRILKPGLRTGEVRIPSSKSQMHRLMIASALGTAPVGIRFDGLSKDIAATASCLNALGATISSPGPGRLLVHPIASAPRGRCDLFCGESGSTLRFLLPVCGVLGAEAVFHMEGRLPERPLAPFDDQLRLHGMKIERDGSRLHCSGQLRGGDYVLPGDVSSQYVTGLLTALPLAEGRSSLHVAGELESAAYVAMTEDILRQAGIVLHKRGNDYEISGGQSFLLPAVCRAEGDYSNAAFFLCMGALSSHGVLVRGLRPDSVQGDRAVVDFLRAFGAELSVSADGILARHKTLRGITIDAGPIPDLVPVLSALAVFAGGETRIVHADRLRLKESDRLETTAALLRALGADVTVTEDGLRILGGRPLSGGVVQAAGDHRIAMAAAVCACGCSETIVLDGAESVEKSYPRFWKDFDSLKGDVA